MSTHKQLSSLSRDINSQARDKSRNSRELASPLQTPLSKPSKKRLADGSLANHNQNKVQTLASFSIGGLQRSLPSIPRPAAPAIDVAKEIIEEKRLRRSIEEAERRMLGLDFGQLAASGMTTAKGTEQAIQGHKQELNRKERNSSRSSEKERWRRRASSFLEWKEPVLR